MQYTGYAINKAKYYTILQIQICIKLFCKMKLKTIYKLISGLWILHKGIAICLTFEN